MSNFFGGYALGVIVVAAWVLERARQDAGTALIFGVVFGWLFGVAAWGLLP